MSEPIIEATQLMKVYRDFWRRPKVRAVNDISFSQSSKAKSSPVSGPTVPAKARP